MIHRRIAEITILSLVLLAVCCQVLPSGHMHDEMQTMPEPSAHLALLAMDIPSSALLLTMFIVSMLWLAVAFSIELPDVAPPRLSYLNRPPDSLFVIPLRLAFADGILNPKLY